MSFPRMTPEKDLPAQLTDVPPPKNVAEAIGTLHLASTRLLWVVRKMSNIWEDQQITPEMHTVVINEGNKGLYTTIDRAKWTCKSVGIINPGAAPVFIGVGGLSARPGSRAPSCPGAAAMVLPVQSDDIELGCDPTVLAADTAVLYLFRYVTVQPPMFSGG